MKNIKLFPVVLALTTSAAAADVAWVKTQFWQSPYYTTTQAQISSPSADLLKSCRWLKGLAYNERGKTRITTKKDMEFIRKMPVSNSMEAEFSAEILTTLPINGDILSETHKQELFKVADQASEKTILPFYTQRNQEVRLDYFSESNIIVSPTEKSYSALSYSLGLNPLPMKLLRRGNGIYLKVLGLDTACDLVYGLAQVTVQIDAQIKILFEEQLKIGTFYTFVENAYSEAESKAKSYRSRAAIFGAKLGNQLAQDKSKSEEVIENQIESLMDFLFVDNNFSYSSAWKIQGQKRFLTLDGTSQPVKIKIEIR